MLTAVGISERFRTRHLGRRGECPAAWLAAPTADPALADHLANVLQPLQSACAALRDQATQLASDREDLWAPIALQLGEWAKGFVAVMQKIAADRQVIVLSHDVRLLLRADPGSRRERGGASSFL